MFEYKKFDNPAELLLKLCIPPQDEKETELWASVGYDLAHDKEYRTKYMNALRIFVGKNYHAIENNQYVPCPFPKLHKYLERRINNKPKDKEIYLVPSYAVFDLGKKENKKVSKDRLNMMKQKIMKNKD